MKSRRLLIWLITSGWVLFCLLGWFHSKPIFMTMPAFRHEYVPLAAALTVLGNPLYLILATICMAVFLAFQTGGWKLPLTLALTMLVGWLLMEGLKLLWAIPRPPGPYPVPTSGYTYPSGHAMMGCIFYGFLAWILIRSNGKARLFVWIPIVITILVGLSRPFLGVHYPVDVIGGWAAGTAYLAMVILLYDGWYLKEPTYPPKDGVMKQQ